MQNLLQDLPTACADEIVDVLARSDSVRIERIVSTGQSSPAGFWYDQEEHEWVAVLRGHATLQFEDGEVVALSTGDHVLIPAHRKHRVNATSKHEATVWLAVFFSMSDEG